MTKAFPCCHRRDHAHLHHVDGVRLDAAQSHRHDPEIMHVSTIYRLFELSQLGGEIVSNRMVHYEVRHSKSSLSTLGIMETSKDPLLTRYPPFAWKSNRFVFFDFSLNHYFNCNNRRYSWWFEVGTVVSLCLLPVSVIVLIRTVVSLVSELLYSAPASSSMDLTPVLPGVNIPLSDLPFYLSTLVICGVLHEFGHALAASWEGVRINKVGAFVVIIFPGAYVDLSSEVLSKISPWRRIKIFSAGIWHNLVIAGAAWALLLADPVVLTPVFRAGVSVVSVVPDSGADGPSGLWSGDEILSVNECKVTNLNDWQNCLML